MTYETDRTRYLKERHADLFRIRDQGGCYFVPAAHMDFVGKVEKFVSILNGNLRRFPIPAGRWPLPRSCSIAFM